MLHFDTSTAPKPAMMSRSQIDAYNAAIFAKRKSKPPAEIELVGLKVLVLGVLAHGKPMLSSAIAAELEIGKPSATSAMTELVRMGLAERAGTDRPASWRLTAVGLEAARDLAERPKELEPAEPETARPVTIEPGSPRARAVLALSESPGVCGDIAIRSGVSPAAMHHVVRVLRRGGLAVQFGTCRPLPWKLTEAGQIVAAKLAGEGQ